jgi:hypothetical protein
MIDLFTPVQENKIICTMHADGTISWKYHLWSDRKKCVDVLEINSKTAVLEIELQQFTQTNREMNGNDLVITYSK